MDVFSFWSAYGLQSRSNVTDMKTRCNRSVLAMSSQSHRYVCKSRFSVKSSLRLNDIVEKNYWKLHCSFFKTIKTCQLPTLLKFESMLIVRTVNNYTAINASPQSRTNIRNSAPVNQLTYCESVEVLCMWQHLGSTWRMHNSANREQRG